MILEGFNLNNAKRITAAAAVGWVKLSCEKAGRPSLPQIIGFAPIPSIIHSCTISEIKQTKKSTNFFLHTDDVVEHINAHPKKKKKAKYLGSCLNRA
jgi:hypothetical protein